MEFLTLEKINESLDRIYSEEKTRMVEGVCRTIFEDKIEYQFLNWSTGQLSENTFETLSAARKALAEMENRADFLIVEKSEEDCEDDDDADHEKKEKKEKEDEKKED